MYSHSLLNGPIMGSVSILTFNGLSFLLLRLRMFLFFLGFGVYFFRT